MSRVGASVERVRRLWRRALEENATPKKLALGVAAGVFIGAAPLIGLRTVSAAAVAWLARLNELTTVLAAHVLFGPLAVATVIVEVRIGAALLGEPMPTWHGDSVEHLRVARHALRSWCAGSALVAPLLAAAAGSIAYFAAVRWHRRKGRAEDDSGASPAGPTAGTR